MLLARRGVAISAAGLGALLLAHGSEAQAASLVPAVLAASPAPASPYLGGSALKLAAGLAVVGAASFALLDSTPARTTASASVAGRGTAPTPGAAAPAATPTTPPLTKSASATRPTGSAVKDSYDYVPPSNPYAPALALFSSWSAADQAAAREGKPLSASARADLPALRESLRSGHRAAEVDWGVDYGQGWRLTVPHVGAMRFLAQVLLRADQELPPIQQAEDALAVHALGGHLGREGVLAELLSGWAVADNAAQALQALLPKLNASDARELEAALRALPPGGELATALAIEKTFFLDQVTQALRDELLAALGPESGLADSPVAKDNGVAPAASLSHPDSSEELPPLRLNGVLQEGERAAISLEGRGGAFWLRSGETRDDLTLLEVNIPLRRATLLFRGRPLLLDLESRRFTAPALAVLEAAARRLPNDSLCAMMLGESPAGSIGDFLRAMQDSIRQVGELYAEIVEHPERFKDEAVYRQRLTALSGMARNIAVGVPRVVARAEEHRATQARLIEACAARAAAAD